MLTIGIFVWAEIAALLTSLICIKWLYKTPYFIFVPYMAMTVLAEYSGYYFGVQHRDSSQLSPILLYLFPGYFKAHKPVDTNILVYNFSLTIEYLVFFFIYYVNIHKPLFKKALLVITIIFFSFAVVDLVFIHGLFVYNSTKMLIGTVGIILAQFLYLYDAFENNEPVMLLRQPMFWIGLGIFFFYLGDFTFNLMFDYLRKKNLLRHSHVFVVINHNLIIFEYVCISIGLIICSRIQARLRRPSLQSV